MNIIARPVFLLACALCALSTAFAASADRSGIIVLGSGRGATDAKKFLQTIGQAQEGQSEIEPVQVWAEPDEIVTKAAAVVFSLDSPETRAWTQEEKEKITDWVNDGGILVFVGNAAHAVNNRDYATKDFGPLLGGARLVKLEDKSGSFTIENAGDWLGALAEPLKANPPVASGGFLLTQITSAEVGIVTQAGALVTRNEAGKGKVLFVGCDIMRQPPEQADLLYRVIAGVLPGVKLAATGQVAPVKITKANEKIAVGKISGAALASGWGLEPLGPSVEKGPVPEPPRKRIAEPGFESNTARGEPVPLVQDGQATGIIVVPDETSPDVKWGAEKIQDVVQKMSGAVLPILLEKDLVIETTSEGIKVLQNGVPVPALFVGNSATGAKLGFKPEELREEGLRVATVPGQAAFIYGRDLSAKGMETHGTLNAVSHFLERQLGYRALWPGENGEVVAENKTVTIAPVDEKDAPAIPFRVMRSTGYTSNRAETGMANLGREKDEYADEVAKYGDWARLQKLGRSVDVSYGHSFHGWWEKYGESHPEWFALQPDGTRIQKASGESKIVEREMLSFTNPSLADFVAEEKIKELSANPDLLAVSISPNDGSTVNFVCMSEEARKFDPPNADPISLLVGKGKRVKYPALTDRYLTFFNRVAEKVSEKFPDRYVAAYAYAAYRAAPLYQPVHPNLLVGFVGFFYFDDNRQRGDEEHWNRWAAKAKYIFLRPNLLLGGYGYPANYAKRMAADLRHCYETGMMGADYSSVAGHWANAGLMYYLLPKLLWNPTADVQALVADYLEKGYGPAAPAMESYYAQVEQLNRQAAAATGSKMDEVMQDEDLDDVKPGDVFQKLAPGIYNAKAVGELRSHLAEARKLAGDDPKILQRIDFVEQGLRFTEFQGQLYAEKDRGEAADSAKMRDLLERRNAFFQDLFKTNFFAVGLGHLSQQEGWVVKNSYGWKPPVLARQEGAPVSP